MTATQRTGSVRTIGSKRYARIRIGSADQIERRLPHCHDDESAQKRVAVIAAAVEKLLRAGRVSMVSDFVAKLAVAQTDKRVAAIVQVVDGVCASSAPVGKRGELTFSELGRRWVDGELARDFPDHVRVLKSPKNERARLRKYINPVLGPLPLSSITVDDVQRVMTKLPKDLAPATRRHVAQIVHRLLVLAAFPMRAIAQSPLPRGFMPKLSDNKAKTFLYPAEEQKLLVCTKVPLDERVLYALLAREGLRLSEALFLEWDDLDLDQGVITLDQNKTDDPRMWKLGDDVRVALRRYRDIVGTDEPPFAGLEPTRAADRFRVYLAEAGVARKELFRKSENRMRVRVHDLRATFVTLALSMGKSETFVADRTGHRSSAMINRYRRSARTASELSLGWLAPMTLIPELSEDGEGCVRDVQIAAMRALEIVRENRAKPRAKQRMHGFKIRRPKGREGSSPSFGTTEKKAANGSSVAAAVDEGIPHRSLTPLDDVVRGFAHLKVTGELYDSAALADDEESAS